MTGHLDEAARLLRDAETDQYTAHARWMLDLARTHAAIAQAEATERLADQLAYRRADNRATQALLEPYKPEHVVHVGDVWGHSGRRYVVTEALEDGWVVLDREGGIGVQTWVMVDDLTRERSRWRLLERDGKPWPPAPEQEPARKAGVKPATDEDIADDEAMCLSNEPLDWDEECTREAVLALIARVRQEKAWRIRSQDEAEEAALKMAAMGENLRSAERERDEAVARAEKAEREIARLWPVVEAAVDWDMEMADLDDLAVAVAEYRAARKETGGKPWLPAQDFIGRAAEDA